MRDAFDPSLITHHASPKDLLIEKMMEKDLPEVMAIENVSFSAPFTENLFRMELNLDVAHLYVARSEGKVVGYIDFWRAGPEIHLITIATHPDWRKRGIARTLMDLMLKDARENSVEKVTLDVRPSNKAGLALYRRYGFEQVGIRKGYYHDNNEDALVLSLSLKEKWGFS